MTENVYVPVGAVSAIYARETGAGMGFEVQPYEPPAAGAQGTAEPAEEGTADAASPSGDDTGGDEQAPAPDHRQVSPAGSCGPARDTRRARSVRARRSMPGLRFHYNAVPARAPWRALPV